MSLAPVPARPRAWCTSARRRWPCRRCRPSSTAGFDVALVVTRPDKRRGRGSEADAQPGEGGGARARACRSAHRVDDVLGVGADLGVVVAFGALIKPPVLAELAMVNLHFSLAAPLARARRRSSGRCWPATTETGVCVMAARGGPRHRPGVRPRIGAHRRRRDGGGAAPDRWSTWARGCWSTRCSGGLHDPGAPGGRADLRGQDRPGRPAASTGSDRRSSWTASCASAGRGRRSGAGGSRCSPQGPSLVASLAAPGTLDGDRVATGDGALVLATVQPEGKAASAGDGVAQRRPSGPGRGLRSVTPSPAAWPTTRSSASTTTAPTPTWSLPTLLERSRLDQRDRAFVTELVYGTTRMRRACDFARRPLRDASRQPARPPHAAAPRRLPAVVRRRAGPRRRGRHGRRVAPGRSKAFVNAVLRRVASAPVDWPDEATRLSLPRLDRRAAHAPSSARRRRDRAGSA